MSEDLSTILAECLDQMENENISLQEILSRYPEYAEELANYLPAVARIDRMNQAAPSPSFKHTSPHRLLAKLPDRKTAPGFMSRIQRTDIRFSLKAALAWSFLAIFVLSLFGGGTVYASGSSLPGDLLYPVKRSVEDARIWLSSPEQAEKLQIQFLQTRLDEIQSLIDQNREQDIETASLDLIKTLEKVDASTAIHRTSEGEEAVNETDAIFELLENRQLTLEKLLESAPVQAVPGLENALQKAKENAKIPEATVSSPENSPEPDPEKQAPGQLKKTSQSEGEKINKQHNTMSASSTPTPTFSAEQQPYPTLTPTRSTGRPGWAGSNNIKRPGKKP